VREKLESWSHIRYVPKRSDSIGRFVCAQEMEVNSYNSEDDDDELIKLYKLINKIRKIIIYLKLIIYKYIYIITFNNYLKY